MKLTSTYYNRCARYNEKPCLPLAGLQVRADGRDLGLQGLQRHALAVDLLDRRTQFGHSNVGNEK